MLRQSPCRTARHGTAPGQHRPNPLWPAGRSSHFSRGITHLELTTRFSDVRQPAAFAGHCLAALRRNAGIRNCNHIIKLALPDQVVPRTTVPATGGRQITISFPFIFREALFSPCQLTFIS
jgi:hypothetical protein